MDTTSLPTDIFYLKYDFIRCQREVIYNIVRYLNREIGVESLPDNIRNMNDAWNAVSSWNKEIYELDILRTALISNKIHLPEVSHFKVTTS
ncbi:hypothetical protein LJC00_03650 [Dysgonomonas sp. OttesenSCG-928-M03]|nr:hypothetical protein [Dysgonomonas sp. OttesenSCG-928-M03]